jgi:ABC-2 type transport system permease protein
MRAREVDAIVRVPGDFSRRLAQGDARCNCCCNGVDSTPPPACEGYVSVGHHTLGATEADRSGQSIAGAGVQVVQRMWFNEANSSTWYLVPGLIVLIMTLIGAFLTSLLIAREWERGTLESLFVTPVRPLEIVLAKLAPYLLVGAMLDLALCLLAARFLFEVPLRGSLWVRAGLAAVPDRSRCCWACSSPARRATSSRRVRWRCSSASCRR